MMIKDNFNLSYDLSGNLLKSVERLIRSVTEKLTISNNWKGDSAESVVGICKNGVNNGG